MKDTIRRSALLLPLGALLLSGCGNAAKEKQTELFSKKPPKLSGIKEGESPKDLFPSTVGAQVVYELVGAKGTRQVTFSIIDVKDVPNGKQMTVDIIDNDGKSTDQTVWRVDDKGLAQISARNGQIFTPPQTLVQFPIKFSESRKYNGKGPLAFGTTTGQIIGEVRVRGTEIVETAMGDIEALAVDALYTWTDNKVKFLSKETAWVAPKYGIVRFNQTVAAQNEKGQTQSQSQSLIMKNFSEKKG